MVKPRTNQQGSLMVELVVAMGILSAAILPLGFSFIADRHQCRAAYERAVAMELVDGEMEVLAAGEWRAFGEGSHDYPLHAGALHNLPAGRFTLIVHGRQLRLEWKPGHGLPVAREATGQ